MPYNSAATNCLHTKSIVMSKFGQTTLANSSGILLLGTRLDDIRIAWDLFYPTLIGMAAASDY